MLDHAIGDRVTSLIFIRTSS